MQSSEASKKYLLRGKKGQYQGLDTWVDSKSERVAESCPHYSLKLLLCSTSEFPLVNHFDLLGSQSIFGISQDPPKCAQASLSQNGFYRKGIWVGNIP